MPGGGEPICVLAGARLLDRLPCRHVLMKSGLSNPRTGRDDRPMRIINCSRATGIRCQSRTCACLWLIDNRSRRPGRRVARGWWRWRASRRCNARVTSGKCRWCARLLFTIIINTARSLARSLVSHFGDNVSADTPVATIQSTTMDHNGTVRFILVSERDRRNNSVVDTRYRSTVRNLDRETATRYRICYNRLIFRY